MYFYHQSLSIHSYPSPNSCPNSASSRTKRLAIEPRLYILQSLQSLQIHPNIPRQKYASSRLELAMDLRTNSQDR
ncbi:unnamed protein product [Bathycoccus prasinos]